MPRPWLAILLLALPFGGCKFYSDGKNAEGVTQFQRGNHVAALERFNDAISAEPMNADSYYNFGAAYYQLGKQQGRQDYLSQAEAYYNQCLQRDPNHADCYRGLSVLLVEQGRTDTALKLLESWAMNQPASATPRVELARLHEELGNVEAAQKNLLEAIAVDGNSDRAFRATGHLAERAGDRERALAAYQRALTLNPYQPGLSERIASLGGVANRSDVAPAIPTTGDGTRIGTGPGGVIR